MTAKNRPSLSLALCACAAVALGALCPPFSVAVAEKRLTGAVTLSSKDRVSVVLDREKAADGTYIVLKIVVPQDVKIDGFMLPDPPRIVLDMVGASVKRSETFSAPANDLVKAVRLGSHPGKLRVVVDLVKSEAPKYEWRAGKRQVILRMLEKAATASQEPSALPAAKEPAAPAPLESESLGAAEPPLPAALPKGPDSLAPQLPAAVEEPQESLGKAEEQAQQAAPEEAKLEPQQQEKAPAEAPQKAAAEQPKEEPAPAAQPPAEQAGSLGAAAAQADKGLPAQGDIKIIGYRFEYGQPGKTPILKVTLNSNGATAQISKVDSTTYKIVVPKSALANEDLVLPQFPPADFVGFIMVMSEEVSGSVEITVSVEEEVTLSTMVKGDEIWALASSAPS